MVKPTVRSSGLENPSAAQRDDENFFIEMLCQDEDPWETTSPKQPVMAGRDRPADWLVDLGDPSTSLNYVPGHNHPMSYNVFTAEWMHDGKAVPVVIKVGTTNKGTPSINVSPGANAANEADDEAQTYQYLTQAWPMCPNFVQGIGFFVQRTDEFYRWVGNPFHIGKFGPPALGTVPGSMYRAADSSEAQKLFKSMFLIGIVMERGPGSDLSSYLKEPDASMNPTILFQIIYAIAVMTHLGIMHFDLRPTNILVNFERGRGKGRMVQCYIQNEVFQVDPAAGWISVFDYSHCQSPYQVDPDEEDVDYTPAMMFMSELYKCLMLMCSFGEDVFRATPELCEIAIILHPHVNSDKFRGNEFLEGHYETFLKVLTEFKGARTFQKSSIMPVKPVYSLRKKMPLPEDLMSLVFFFLDRPYFQSIRDRKGKRPSSLGQSIFAWQCPDRRMNSVIAEKLQLTLCRWDTQFPMYAISDEDSADGPPRVRRAVEKVKRSIRFGVASTVYPSLSEFSEYTPAEVNRLFTYLGLPPFKDQITGKDVLEGIKAKSWWKTMGYSSEQARRAAKMLKEFP